jgi:hypothetical protein
MAENATNKVSSQGRSKVPENESDSQRFVRLAELRVGNSIESIRKVALLGNKAQYEYTDDQVTTIEGALVNAVTSCVKALRSGKASTSSFRL